MSTEKSVGISLKKIGAKKCFWIGLKKFGIEKRLWIGKLKILGLVTHWTTDALLLKVYLIRDSSPNRDLFDILAPYWVPIYFSGSLFAMFWLDSHEKNFPWVPIRSLFHKKGGFDRVPIS